MVTNAEGGYLYYRPYCLNIPQKHNTGWSQNVKVGMGFFFLSSVLWKSVPRQPNGCLLIGNLPSSLQNKPG